MLLAERLTYIAHVHTACENRSFSSWTPDCSAVQCKAIHFLQWTVHLSEFTLQFLPEIILLGGSQYKPVKLKYTNLDLLIPSFAGGEQFAVGTQLQPGPDEEVSAVLGAQIQQVGSTYNRAFSQQERYRCS